MKETIRKIAYLRGLCEGYGFDENTKEGVIFSGILDVLDDLADILDQYEFPDEEEEEAVDEQFEEEDENTSEDLD